MCLTVYNGTSEEITKWWVSEWFLRSFHTGFNRQQWSSTVNISSTDFRTFRHEILIAKHVRACRHAPASRCRISDWYCVIKLYSLEVTC